MLPGRRLSGGKTDFDKGLRANGTGGGEEVVADDGPVTDDAQAQSACCMTNSYLIVGDGTVEAIEHREYRAVQWLPKGQGIAREASRTVQIERRPGSEWKGEIVAGPNVLTVEGNEVVRVVGLVDGLVTYFGQRMLGNEARLIWL